MHTQKTHPAIHFIQVTHRHYKGEGVQENATADWFSVLDMYDVTTFTVCVCVV